MKSNLFVALLFVLVLHVFETRAQEFTLTTTPANIISSKASIDMPGLTGNALAIIVATPIGNTEALNPQPIGAWYYSGKWNIFNTNHSVMPPGAKYRIRFFLQSGPNQFLHVVTQKNLGSEGSYIDHPALNNNPNAQLQILQNHAPEVRSPYNLNRFAARASYSPAAGRWYIANVNDEPLSRATAYNIVVVSSGGIADRPPATSGVPPVASVPNSRPPAGPDDTAKVAVPTVTSPIASQVPPGQPTMPVAEAVPPASTKVAVPPNAGKQPDRGWALVKEPPPAIGPNAQILLFIHGMDSRAEEADDITRALFALVTNRPASSGQPPTPPPPVSGPPQNAQMVILLQQLLQKYKGCILEKYETQQDMIERGLPGNLSGLAHTGGLQDRDTGVVCIAGNICSRTARLASFGTLKAQADRGDPTNFQTNLERTIPKDCFQYQKHQEWHTKHVHCTMEAGGNSGFQGPYFEGCKAGVDLEKMATDAVKEIAGLISNISGTVPETQAVGGPSIATNYSTVKFATCADPAKGCPEQCSYPDDLAGGQRRAVLPSDLIGGQQVRLYFAPIIPPSLLDSAPRPNTQINVPAAHNIGSNEGRLRPDLRQAAADADPQQSLRLAAYQFAAGNHDLGKAFADLSVTGHKAFDQFTRVLPQESFCQSLSSQRPAGLNESDVVNGCRTALDRAYRVANYLRTGQRGDTSEEKARKTNERIALGWIAVSGEDDSPHRPVNVPSSDFPQYDINVVVEAPLATGLKSVTVRTRYWIAQSQPNGGSTAKNLVVISLDLPSSGYSFLSLINRGENPASQLPVHRESSLTGLEIRPSPAPKRPSFRCRASGRFCPG